MLDQLDGRVFFGTDDAGRYRTQHPAWSLRFLEEGLTRDDRARREAKAAFERAVNALFALVDEEARRTAIRDELRAAPPVFEEIEEDLEAAAERYIQAIFSIGEQRPGLAPLFGRSKYADLELPSVVSAEYEWEVRTHRGHFWLYAGVYEYAEEEYTAARELGDRAGEATSLNNLGLVARRLGEYEQARDYLQQSLDIFRELGDRQGEAQSLNNLGLIADALGDYEQAREHYERARDRFRQLGVIHEELQARRHRIRLEAATDNHERARERCEAAFGRLDSLDRDLPEEREEFEALCDDLEEE